MEAIMKEKVEGEKIKLGVIGASGRMGQLISELACVEKKWSLIFGIGRNEKLGFKYYFKNLKEIECLEIEKDSVDVLIDFSSVEVSMGAMAWAARTGIPVVSGTTGFSKKNWEEINRWAQKTRILWAPNMSLGVAALKKSLQGLSLVSGFEFQIHESHHTEKKDSPSGTALMLQEELKEIAKEKDVPIFSTRKKEDIGQHVVLALGEEEVLSFEHRATDRKVFARGALRAASWIISQKKRGLYSLEDVF